MWRHRPFERLVLLTLTLHGLWRPYFGGLSRQISLWTFLELQLTILACKPYASCACCVKIKFRVHVYCVYEYRGFSCCSRCLSIQFCVRSTIKNKIIKYSWNKIIKYLWNKIKQLKIKEVIKILIVAHDGSFNEWNLL